MRDRTARRAVATSSAGDAGLAVLCVIGALALAWMFTYGAGGSKTVLPHAFYVPVVMASIRFRARGALIMSVVAGLAAGPLMPLDVAARTAQPTLNWAGRMLFFVVVGQLVAYLSHHSVPSLTRELTLRRFRGELDAGIATGQLRLEYQPIVDLTDGSLAGVEALVRWDHPDRGAIAPDDFIPEAERAGCVDRVTRYVITEACRQLDQWRNALPAGVDFTLAVNLSALDLTDDTLPEFIAEVLERHALPNHWLHLEITETALVADLDAAIDGLMRLRMLGLRIAIDDFGTGESSLASLHRFPADVVKIDRFFVRHLDEHSAGLALAQGVVALAHTLNLGAVAEGIETAAQARAVRAMGCPRAQGYLFAKPMRPAAIAALLADPRGFQQANRAHLTPAGPAGQHLPGTAAANAERSPPGSRSEVADGGALLYPPTSHPRAPRREHDDTAGRLD